MPSWLPTVHTAMFMGGRVIRTQYWNPADDSAVTGQLVSEADLPGLLGTVLEFSGGRGHPALELVRQDGSALIIATDGPRCALVWVNALKESLHRGGGGPGPVLVYDYFGSWTRCPQNLRLSPGKPWNAPVASSGSAYRTAILSSSSQTDPNRHPLLPR